MASAGGRGAKRPSSSEAEWSPGGQENAPLGSQGAASKPTPKGARTGGSGSSGGRGSGASNWRETEGGLVGVEVSGSLVSPKARLRIPAAVFRTLFGTDSLGSVTICDSGSQASWTLRAVFAGAGGSTTPCAKMRLEQMVPLQRDLALALGDVLAFKPGARRAATFTVWRAGSKEAEAFGALRGSGAKRGRESTGSCAEEQLEPPGTSKPKQPRRTPAPPKREAAQRQAADAQEQPAAAAAPLLELSDGPDAEDAPPEIDVWIGMAQLLDSMAGERCDQRCALLAFRSAFAAVPSAAARMAQFRQLSALHAAGDWEAVLSWLNAACCAAGVGGGEGEA